MADQLYGWSLSATFPAMPSRSFAVPLPRLMVLVMGLVPLMAMVLPCGPSAVDDNLRARDVACRVGAKEHDGPGNLGGLPKAAGGTASAQAGHELGVVLLALGIGERARHDRVHANALPRQHYAVVTRHLQHARLGDAVVDRVGWQWLRIHPRVRSNQPIHAAEVNDAPRVPRRHVLDGLAADEERTGEADAHPLFPLDGGHLIHRSASVEERHVDNTVHPPVLLHNGLGAGDDRFFA